MEQDFPCHQIWREHTGDRTPRYVARARSLASHPATVITPDLGELRTVLGGGQ
jgi:hypothetical protein